MSDLRRNPTEVAVILMEAARQLTMHPERAEFIGAQLANVAKELDRRDMR